MKNSEPDINAKFRALFDNMSSGVIIYVAADQGNDFIIADINQAVEKIEHVNKQAVAGRSLLEVFPGVKEFGLFAVLQRVYRSGQPEHFPIGFYRDQRISGWRENYVYRLPTGEIIVVYDDVTERKLNEEKLNKLINLRDEFVNTASHELRTPMEIIHEGVAQVLDGLHGALTEEQKKFLSSALQNVDRLTRIVNDLLDLARLQAGKIEIKKVPLDFTALVRDTATTFRLPAQAKGLWLKPELPDRPLMICADYDKLVEVLTNLLGNALKFTERGGITIAVSEREQEIECCIADTGRGITAADQQKLFDKFRQFGHMPGSGAKGTGLGLSIVKSLLELHGGRIRVESAEGQGSKFIFTLPKNGN